MTEWSWFSPPINVTSTIQLCNCAKCCCNWRWTSITGGRRGRDRMVSNYLCNQCLSPLEFEPRSWRRVIYANYAIQFVSDLRQVGGFLRVLRFPPHTHTHTNWPPRYYWNMVKNGIKHHKPNLSIHNRNPYICTILLIYVH